MELRLTTNNEQAWKDALLKNLFEYAIQVVAEPAIYQIRDMDAFFTFLQGRMAEFLKANPKYCKPAGFSLTYSRPSCCAPSIEGSYLDQKFTVNITHVKP
jgi:hypothetical protein